MINSEYEIKLKNEIDMNQLKFRYAEADDLEAIIEINNQNIDKWDTEKFEQVFLYEIPFILLIYENTIIGFLVYMNVLDEARLVNLSIHQDYRYKGNGKTLLNFGLKKIIEDGNKYVLLDVRVSNMAALQLYTHFGFRILCTRENFYPDLEDSYFMQLTL